MKKSDLRYQYLDKRLQLTDEECDALSQKLLDQFITLNLSGVNCIHLFLPIIKNNEPDTYLIRNWLKIHHPEIKIVLPKSDFSTLTMTSYADDAELILAENKYGIPEPIEGNLVEDGEIDMVLLPMLVFDKAGYRVGYGKGFYDRFTAQCKPEVRLIGLSFFKPVERIDNVNEYDVRMEACITPEEIYWW